MKKPVIRLTAAFLATVILAVLLLLLGACLPQEPIDANVLKSAEKMVQQGDYPVMADHSFASILDYFTDSLILAESKATTISQWETIFTNPLYQHGDRTLVEHLYNYAQNSDLEPTKFYTQYWMGFRPIMRLMLSFLDYYQILRYVALGFFVLFTAAICSVSKHTNAKTAFLFALSIIFVRPHVIAVSLQFSFVFLIAFGAMLLVPWIHKHPKWESLFFLELGIVTMYFDFYTVPFVTFGLPMIYLYLLREQDGHHIGVKQVLKSTMLWGIGYVGMWIAKLLLTSLLTPASGLGTGFTAFAERIGITKMAGFESYYNPMKSLYTVALSLFSDEQGKLMLALAIVVTFACLFIRFLRVKPGIRQFFRHIELVIIAMIPVIWFMVAAQPTANHHWFQYRSIAVSFWAGFAYLQYLLKAPTVSK